MGYRIVYGTEAVARQEREKSHLRILTTGFLLALVAAVRLFWPQGTALLRQTFLPRENSAYMQLQSDIQAGEPLGEAVTAFCRQIVEEAIGENR